VVRDTDKTWNKKISEALKGHKDSPETGKINESLSLLMKKSRNDTLSCREALKGYLRKRVWPTK